MPDAKRCVQNEEGGADILVCHSKGWLGQRPRLEISGVAPALAPEIGACSGIAGSRFCTGREPFEARAVIIPIKSVEVCALGAGNR
jgi:hypothetical protein